jgi:hypothetical protein
MRVGWSIAAFAVTFASRRQKTPPILNSSREAPFRIVAMTPFSFVHAADLHLDSPFKGITADAPETAEILRRASFPPPPMH